MGTIIVGLILLAAVAMAILSIVKNQGSCCGGCSNCKKSCGKCHSSTTKGMEKLLKESRTRHAG